MEIRIENKKKYPFPDRRKLHKIWKVLLAGLVICLLAGGMMWQLGRRATAQAALTPEKYEPFVVLEILPYEGQAQWGYMVSGQEPIKADEVNAYYTNEAERKYYWTQGNGIQNTFDYEFKFADLVRNSEGQNYTNKDTLIHHVLCRDGGDPAAWAGKVKVISKNACDVTVQDVNLADLIVIQSSETANAKNLNGSRSPLYVYSKYKKPSVSFRSQNGTAIDVMQDGQITYDSQMSIDNGASWKSLDMNWETVLAVLDHAYGKKKATIVAYDNTDLEKADGNMDKLILLLTKLTRKSYLDDGIRELITPNEIKSYTNDVTGSFNGQKIWNAALFFNQVLIRRETFVNAFNPLNNFLYNPVANIAMPETVSSFLKQLSQMGNKADDIFYSSMDTALWESIISYAEKVQKAGKITEEQYRLLVSCREKYEKKQIYRNEDRSAIGYDVIGSEGYRDKTDWDNVIRYRGSQRDFPFLPSYFNNDYQIDVKEILEDSEKNQQNPNPPGEITDGRVKVLEIEPCNSYWLSNSDNLLKLAKSIGVPEEEISVTYVTPNALNGMAVDLVAEYDVIYIGDLADYFAEDSNYRKGGPYRHIGYWSDAVVTQTLLNGLLADDYTNVEEFNANIQLKTPGAVLNTGTFPLTSSTSPYWNEGIREQWGNNANKYFLKNVELSLKLQKAGVNETLSRARFSGNDLTRNMQKQLAEFVKSGQPVITTRKLVEDAYKRINEFGALDAFDDDPKDMEPDIDKEASSQDNRLYYGLAGIEDERIYYGSRQPLDKSYLENEIYVKDDYLENTVKPINLRKDYKPEVNIRDAETVKNEEGETVPTIAGKGTSVENKPDISGLAKTSHLSFNYEITLPQGDQVNNCVMTVVIDRNGDGIFDEAGDGKTADGKPGKQHNATETIKSDQVFTMAFSELPPTEYVLTGGTVLSGTYATPLPVDSIEEICQFQVKVSTKDKDNSLRGIWTGYMRPELKKKTVKILQIAPYAESNKGSGIWGNAQFKTLLEEAELNGGEYHFNFSFEGGEEPSFDTVTEADFAMQCADKEITAESLKQYDLIIAGTDFTSDLRGDIIDIDTEEAAAVLKTYADTLKRPIIFTNDAFSYVNSENYVAPEEIDYYYRNMTIEEGERYKPVETNPDFRKVKITEEEYNAYVEKNKKEWEDNKHNKGEGTVFLDSSLIDEVEKAGTYRAVVRPTSISDGRKITDLYLGWGLWWPLEAVSSECRKVKLYNSTPTNNKFATLSANDFFKWANSAMVYRSRGFLYYSYYARVGYVTERELKDLYENTNQSIKTAKIDGDIFNVKDLHASLGTYEKISKDIVDEEQPVVIAGDTYYKFKSNEKEYLAVRLEEDVVNKYGYVWQIKVPGNSENPVETKYELNDVAGKGDALYPDKNNWNYFLTQSMRYVAGMDRFAVTTKIKSEDKRDNGSSRRWADIKELQGFTNGTLLEYAYLPDAGSGLQSLVTMTSPYDSVNYPKLSLGVKPRTKYIEQLNEGAIGLYPFKISDSGNVSETKIEVDENHPPYYQLDLDREIGEGKIDDVTVWYTFAGSGNADDSQYFDVTAKDAGNNYYLYSKGKIYYTGFSAFNGSDGDSWEETNQSTPELEMKLFVNTIYAALNGEAVQQSYYDTVVKTDGAVSNISYAAKTGLPNQYTCYYDEDTEVLSLSFRIQRQNALTGSNTPIVIGQKAALSTEGIPTVNAFPAESYTLAGISEDEVITSLAFPVVSVTGESGKTGSLGSEASDVWYRLEIPFNIDSSVSGESLDGTTLIIGPIVQEGKTELRTDAIFAEIRLVKRELFDLD